MDRLHITFWNQSCNLGERRKFESVIRHKPHNLIQKNTTGSKFVCWDHVSWSVAISMTAALHKIVLNQYQSIWRLFEYHLCTVCYFFHTVFNAPLSEMASNHATWSKSNEVLYCTFNATDLYDLRHTTVRQMKNAYLYFFSESRQRIWLTQLSFDENASFSFARQVVHVVPQRFVRIVCKNHIGHEGDT